VPRNKQGSAHPLDNKWQITSYLLFWVSNRIFWGAPSGRCLSRRAWERVDVERVMVRRRCRSQSAGLSSWPEGKEKWRMPSHPWNTRIG
jgi:hypothetical protein